MALPSQTERTAQMSRPVMARSNPRSSVNAKKIGAVALIAVVGVAAIWGLSKLLPSGASNGNAQVTGEQGVTDSGKAQPEAPKPQTPPPVSLSQAPGNPRPNTPTGTDAGSALSKALDDAGKVNPPANPTPSGDPLKPRPTDVTNPNPAGAPSGGQTPGGPQSPGASPSGNNPGAGVTPPPADIPSTGSTSQVRSLMEQGERAAAAGRTVEARSILSRALASSDIGRADADRIRQRLSAINQELVFSNKVTAGDPLVEQYTVVSGDSLVKIARKRELATDWRLIQSVNGITNPGALKIGQKLKLVRGPFHAVVSKTDFRLDLFAGPPEERDRWVYIRSYTVGLGEGNSTPVGTYVIKRHSKLVNPHWVNPRTGEKFSADDPKNPIGEYWLGWQGLGSSAVNTGYGLHGTIEPDSIGKQKSMGCVRMLADDIKQIYEMLTEEVSVVHVTP